MFQVKYLCGEKRIVNFCELSLALSFQYWINPNPMLLVFYGVKTQINRMEKSIFVKIVQILINQIKFAKRGRFSVISVL